MVGFENKKSFIYFFITLLIILSVGELSAIQNDDWYVVCSKSDESITLTKQPNNVTHIILKGPFDGEPAARRWVNANYPNWYCAGASGRSGDWYVLCDNNTFAITLKHGQPAASVDQRVLSGPFPSEPQARNWVNTNYPNWNCSQGPSGAPPGTPPLGQGPPQGPPPGGQPGGLVNPLPNCPYEIFAAGIRFGWAWATARWNLGLPSVVVHLTWAGFHMRNANYICSRTPPAWPSLTGHLSAINSFLNQLGRGNMTDSQILSRLHSFSGFASPLACQVIASQLVCNRETCAWHYFLIGYYLGRAQISLQVFENPGMPPDIVKEAKQEVLSSLPVVIRRIRRLPQLGWPGFAWRCRNLSAALPLLTQALNQVNNPNASNRANSVTQSVVIIINALSSGLVTGQSIILAIDLSGSMNAAVSSGSQQTKLDIAKQAALNALNQLPQGAEAAVVSFGATGCDVKLEIGFTRDFQALAARIQALKGSGSTPIANALYYARDYILREGRGGKVSIVLLSDGMESCKGSPVKAAQEVRSMSTSQTITHKQGPPAFFTGVVYAASNGQDPSGQAVYIPATTADAGLNPNPAPCPVTIEDLLGGVQEPPEIPSMLDENAVQPPEPAAGPSESPTGPVQPPPSGNLQDVTIHTIGFGLGANSQAQNVLNQIASAGGGQSHSASNLNTLQQALTSAITSTPSGGGGGGLVMPQDRMNWSVVLLFVLLGGCVILLVAILAVRKRSGAAAYYFGRIDVFYSDGGQKSFNITAIRTSIGRAQDNDLIINDPDVSGYHAVILVSGNNLFLQDKESTNGTELNEKRITQAPLNSGDEIKIGTTRLIFQR